MGNTSLVDRGLALFIVVLEGQDEKEEQKKPRNTPKNPWSPASNSGSAISALTPHTTVVFPSLTRAEPSAVDIEPVVFGVEKRIWCSVDASGCSRQTNVYGNIPSDIKRSPIGTYVLCEESF